MEGREGLAGRPQRGRGQAGAAPPPRSPWEEPLPIPLEDTLDLHAFAPCEVESVVEEYLTQCHGAGFPVVRLIHGKGVGVQRRLVWAVLARLPFIRGYHEAPPSAGGWGATTVDLGAEGERHTKHHKGGSRA